jgi:hypothetical protein
VFPLVEDEVFPLVEDEVFPLVEDEVFPLLLFFRPLDQQGDNIFWQHL